MVAHSQTPVVERSHLSAGYICTICTTTVNLYWVYRNFQKRLPSKYCCWLRHSKLQKEVFLQVFKNPFQFFFNKFFINFVNFSILCVGPEICYRGFHKNFSFVWKDYTEFHMEVKTCQSCFSMFWKEFKNTNFSL